jgi:hypothetical protein
MTMGGRETTVVELGEGGGEEVVGPARVIVAELEHAPSRNAAAENASAARPDLLAVVAMSRIPPMSRLR